jgi:hypothetical protein
MLLLHLCKPKRALNIVHLNDGLSEELLVVGDAWKHWAHCITYLIDLDLLNLLLKVVDSCRMKEAWLLHVLRSHIAGKQLSL